MPEFVRELFSSKFFMPHGHCYLWQPAMVWLQVVSNAFIGLAYVSISATLYVIVRRIGDIPFKRLYLAFGVFIISCGMTHFMDVVTVWSPFYWIDGSIRAVTAVASVGTALLMYPLMPKAIALSEAAQLAHDRGIQIEAANKELARLFEKSKELSQLKTQFFANVSHELRTPLALILGPAERLGHAENLDARQRRDVEVITRNARALLKHVNDLLDVSKLEAGKMVADYAETDLAHEVRVTCSNFETLAADRRLPFTVQALSSMPAQIDSEKIHRVLMNLLSNAFKFTPAGGSVRCTLSTSGRNGEGNWARLEVADSGPGVPAEQRQAIFERFRQLEVGDTRRFGGTGLGLAIAKDFVELHGGRLVAETAPEGGALMIVELPLRAPAGATVRAAALAPDPHVTIVSRVAIDELRAPVAPANTRATGANGGRGVVLVVEDNPDMNRFICESLSSDFNVESAFDGEQGYERICETRPDLVISDIMMPRLSGDQLVRRVREQSELDDIPLLLLTAKADDTLREHLLREGAQDYVTKPFSTEELRARAVNLVTMRRARGVLQRELSTHMLDLETLAHEMTRRKRELQSAVESMRVAREQAERASVAKSDFLSLVSHELRTPLTGLMLQVDRLNRDQVEGLSPKQQKMLETLTASSKRLGALVESVLEYSRVDSGRLEVHPEPLDLALLAAAVIDEHQHLAEGRHLAVRLVCTSPLPPLTSDNRLVRVIIGNLVGNALKFTDSGSVEVALALEANRHVIRVTDTGPGIAEDQQTFVFEPFRHIEPLVGKHTEGVGLGLALVKQLVAALGGDVALTSEEGRGSTFTVRLPSLPGAGR